MMKGLIGHCLSRQTTLDRVKAKAQATEAELGELKAWKPFQEKKLALLEQVQGELEKQTEVLKQVLEDKEKEIKTIKDQLHQAKKTQYGSIMTLTPSQQSSVALLQTALTIASIKSKLFSQTWTCPMFPSMPRPRLQLSLFILRALMNYLLMMPLLTTLMVTKRLLLLKAKLKLKERRHVHLMGDQTVEERHDENPVIQQQFLLLPLYFVYYRFLFIRENSFYSFHHSCFWVFVNNLPFIVY